MPSFDFVVTSISSSDGAGDNDESEERSEESSLAAIVGFLSTCRRASKGGTRRRWLFGGCEFRVWGKARLKEDREERSSRYVKCYVEQERKHDWAGFGWGTGTGTGWH